MTPDEICEVLVRDGILGTETVQGVMLYTFPGDNHLCPAETWLSDWRVAGACLERICVSDLMDLIHDGVSYMQIRNPAAICEAYAKAVMDA